MKLNIPVILGTERPNRKSIHAANFVLEIINKREEVESILVDPMDFDLPYDGNDEENKDPKYSKITKDADAFFIVTPEYNHGYPGTLKRLLDSELENYIHKPVAMAGVSSGMLGGARVIEALVPAVREMGMVVTFKDVLFPKIQDLINEDGNFKEENVESYSKRVNEAIDELIWMTKTLKWGRENIQSKYHNHDYK